MNAKHIFSDAKYWILASLILFACVTPILATEVQVPTEDDCEVIFSVAVNPNGRTIASGGSDSAVRLWDVKTGRQIWVVKDQHGYITSVAFSPDGKILASGCCDKTINLHDVSTGQTLKVLKGHTA